MSVPTSETNPRLAEAEAHADRVARTRRHALNCILLAVVTSPPVSADLIDRAIELTREAGPSGGMSIRV